MRLRDRLPNYLIEADITDYETESSVIIYKDGLETVGVNSQTGVIISHDVNSRVVFNAVFTAMATGGLLFIKKGTYTLDATGGAILATPGSFWVHGEGPTTILNLDGTILQMGSADKVKISDLKIAGLRGLKLYCTADHNTYVLQNIIFNVTGTTDQAAFAVYANDCTISDIWVDKVFFDTCGLHGIQLSGNLAETHELNNIWITDCHAYKCGWSGTWSTGMDLAEGANVSNLFVDNCKVELSWESGIHFEAARTKTNVLITDCISINNGQKGGATYGAGFLVSGGVKLVNCLSSGNLNGFTMTDTGTTATILENCMDIGSAQSFNIGATGTTGKLIGRGCVSIKSTVKSLLVRDASYVDFELIAIGSLSTGSATCDCSSAANPTLKSRFNFCILDPDPTPTIAVVTNSSVNCEYSGFIRATNLVGFKVYNGTDIIIKDMRFDMDCIADAILCTDTLSSILCKNITIENTVGAHVLARGINNAGTAGAVVCERDSIYIKDVTTPYTGCVFTSNWGTSTGTGAEQAISHGLAATPTLVMLSDVEIGANPYQSSAAAADHIHVTAIINQDWAWYARV